MTATVAILTFNARPRIGQLLTALRRQRAGFDWDVLVIDSGSRDGTLDIIRRHAAEHEGAVRVVEIPNTEFGHGKTRNLAARLAGGEFVVFLTHDAVPAHDHWLEAMIRPFGISERVACVYGKQIPWPKTCPVIKRDVIDCFRRFGAPNAISVQEKNSWVGQPGKPRVPTYFTDVNSAIRRSLLLEELPFRDLRYAEDQAFGKDALEAGYLKVYTPFGAVFHSHDYALLSYYRRMYDEMTGLRQATGESLDTPLARHAAWIARATWQDWQFIAKDHAYSRSEKARWLVKAPLYNAARRLAIRLSGSERVPSWVGRLSSLESSLRRAA